MDGKARRIKAEKVKPTPTVTSPATAPARNAFSSAFLLLVSAAAATRAFAFTAIIIPANPEP